MSAATSRARTRWSVSAKGPPASNCPIAARCTSPASRSSCSATRVGLSVREKTEGRISYGWTESRSTKPTGTGTVGETGSPRSRAATASIVRRPMVTGSCTASATSAVP